jgi:magnesium transporter
MAESGSLLPLVRKYFEQDTQGAAHSLERMSEEEAVSVLKALPASLAVRAVRHLQVSYAAELLRDADPALSEAIISGLDPQLAATIFMHLPAEDQRKLLERIPAKLKKEISELLTYPEDSVGRIMTTQFLSFHKDVTCQDAVEKIRSLAQKRGAFSYAYVIDDASRLVGVLNMRDLMLSDPESPLEAVMRQDVFTLQGFTDREEAANELAKRRYFAAPVVDNEGKILGIIKAEQLIQGVREEVTEDLQLMFGVSGDERVSSSLAFSLRKRLPWLHVNLATAFLAASVVAAFESIIAKLTVLAVFLPVVAGQGGNAGAQSMAVVMRGLVMREIPRSRIWAVIMKEGRLGAVNGLATGAVTALVAWLWNGSPYLGLVIGLGMFINLFIAGLSGASVPILMKRLGLDPAQCSSIILTTITDVMGFAAFLGLALLFIDFLV